MAEREIFLSGGNVTPVVRAGATIRRVPGAWTPAVHDLLRHLEASGFAGAPRALGYDEQGREVLSFLDGEAGHYPVPAALWADDTLVAVARLIRGFHDATAGFVPPTDAAWQLVYPDAGRHEVICHNDLAPYNTLYAEALPVAFVDFDLAGPGPGAWDLAYAAYRFVPLENYDAGVLADATLTDPITQRRRLRLFCASYGIASEDVLALVLPRLEQLCATLADYASAGTVAYQRMLVEGHLDHYRRDITLLRAALPFFARRVP